MSSKASYCMTPAHSFAFDSSSAALPASLVTEPSLLVLSIARQSLGSGSYLDADLAIPLTSASSSAGLHFSWFSTSSAESIASSLNPLRRIEPAIEIRCVLRPPSMTASGVGPAWRCGFTRMRESSHSGAGIISYGWPSSTWYCLPDRCVEEGPTMYPPSPLMSMPFPSLSTEHPVSPSTV